MTTRSFRYWICLLSGVLVGAAALAFSADGTEPPRGAEWTRIGEGPHALDASIHETVWRTGRAPFGAHDQIELHHYRSGGASKVALLYLPGTNMNGEAALADEDHNLWFFLAKRGVDVFALDYRTRFVPNDGVEDLSFMKTWTLETFVDDAAAAAALVREEGPYDQLFVAGFSRGVTLAYGLAASEPAGSVAGVIALDGVFKSHAPKGEFDRAAAMEQLATSGVFASDVSGRRGWAWRAKLMADTIADPAGPAQSEAFETIGEELTEILHNAWGPGALANAREQSEPEVLARLLAGYDRYYPTVQNVDGRSMADHLDDPGTPIDDGWAELEVPVLYFGSTGMRRPFGVRWLLDGIHSAAEAGGSDYEIHVLEGYGHLDVLVGESARADVFEPTLAWIESRRP